MKYIPKSVTRLASRSLLKLNVNSPTILVVAGVAGFGATAVLAAKASRKAEPVLENHHKDRIQIAAQAGTQEEEQRLVVSLYANTAVSLGKVYGPTIVVGTLSAASVLYGHKILKGRHVASLLAYSGLQDQFLAYRSRVAKTLGEAAEKDIYDGARGEYQEDPDHKGEYKLAPVWDDDVDNALYLRPFFDELNPNWTRDPIRNYMFLKGVQNHMNDRLQIRGHVFLVEVLDALGMPRVPEAQAAGWLRSGSDGYIDFGFMTSQDPQAIAFRNQAERSVRLNFNIDGNIYERMLNDKYRR